MVKINIKAKTKSAPSDSIPPAGSDSIPPPWVITPVNDSIKRPEVINPNRKKSPRHDNPNAGDVRVNVKYKKVKVRKR